MYISIPSCRTPIYGTLRTYMGNHIISRLRSSFNRRFNLHSPATASEDNNVSCSFIYCPSQTTVFEPPSRYASRPRLQNPCDKENRPLETDVIQLQTPMLLNERVHPYLQYSVCFTTSLHPCRDHKPLAADYHIGNTAVAADANTGPVQVANSHRRLAFQTFLVDSCSPTLIHCESHLGGHSHRSENHQRKSRLLMDPVAVVAGPMESRHS